MDVVGRMRYVAPLLLLLVVGCSARDAEDGGQSSAEPAPSEALAPAPSIRSGTDARTLLRPDGDQDRLALVVADALEDLESLHVQEQYAGERDLRLTYDLDVGRCSGVGIDDGVRFRFVTTADGRMLSTVDDGVLGQRLAGRWVETPGYALADLCASGPLDVVVGGTNGSGSLWLIEDATRVGIERVAGQRAVHFRKSEGEMTADSWVAADGSDARLLKLVRRQDNGNVHTQTFSEFDSADPVDPEPPADRIVFDQDAS